MQIYECSDIIADRADWGFVILRLCHTETFKYADNEIIFILLSWYIQQRPRQKTEHAIWAESSKGNNWSFPEVGYFTETVK